MSKRPALGKGLSAIIDVAKPKAVPAPAAESGPRAVELPFDKVVPNRHQARRAFDDASLAELAESIKRAGIIQPLAVRPLGDGSGRFELIAGERRFRAASLAGLKTVPAVVIETDEVGLSVLSLIENVQRENLNPIDEAEGLQALLDHFSLTQEDIAARLGKSRSAVANSVRLLQLPEKVKNAVAAGELSAGHARALLALQETAAILGAFYDVVAKGLSVRQTEALAARGAKRRTARAKTPGVKDPNLNDYLSRLSEHYGTKVTLAGGKEKGKVEIH
ncbi:MAG: ParB/RepB/Spo0J family partition protein [Deltaproteobacteria bacterium]|nr:ParB/RepB/Spo0J family partition protein [Deltaproteobacteria bacterium]